MSMTTLLKTRQLVAAALCALCIPASAQFTKSVEMYPQTGWSNVPAEFTMTEVAQALQTDTATLRQALDADAEATSASMFYFVGSDNQQTSNYTGNYNEFWVGSEGTAVEYANGVWFCGINWGTGVDDGNNPVDAFNIYFGTNPDQYDALAANGGSYTPKFVLKYGGKEVTFNINYTIKAVPPVQEPTTTVIADLNVVGSTTVNITRQNLDNDKSHSLDASDIISKLGLDRSLLGAQLSQMLYTETLDDAGCIASTLSNEFTADPKPGWWYKKALYPQGDEHQGEVSPNLGSALYNATDSYIYLLNFAYDESSDAITYTSGRYTATHVVGDDLRANVYILYGNKAYRIEYQIVIEETPSQALDDLTSIGEGSIDIDFYDNMGDGQIVNTDIDIQAIAAALGCEIDEKGNYITTDINVYALKDDETFWPGIGTALMGGFWFNEFGYVCNWGADAAIYIQPTADGDWSNVDAGLYSGMVAKGLNNYPIKLYFVYGQKYYQLTVNCSMKHKELLSQDQWKIVETLAAVIQAIPNAESFDVECEAYTLSPDRISSILGTTEFTMYCNTDDAHRAENPSELYASNVLYNCAGSTGIGVWFNENGNGTGYYGTYGAAYVGISWSGTTGAFEVYNIPSSAPSVGKVFTAPIYFVDEETGKMLLLNFTVQFVDEINTAEVVGTEDITLPFTDDYRYVEVDLTKPATALGVTVDELINGNYMKGQLASGLYSAGSDANSGLTFGTDGYCDETGMGDLSFIIEKNGDKYVFNTLSSADIEDNWSKAASFCFEVAGKRYVYNATFVSDAIYTGISEVKADAAAKDQKIYDLSGRRVMNPGKGLYIINGKKYVIK